MIPVDERGRKRDGSAPFMAREHTGRLFLRGLIAALRRLAPPIAGQASALLLAASVLGQGLRANGPATAGGTIQVDVATSDPSIEVTNSATGTTQSYPVGSGKGVTIPVPAQPGAILVLSVGRGRGAQVVLVEVVSP